MKQISGVEEQAVEVLRSNVSLGKRRLANAVPGLTAGRAQSIISKFRKGVYDTKVEEQLRSSPSNTGVRGAMTVDAFVAKHSIKLKLKSVIETELVGRITGDQDLRAHLSINPTLWTKIRESVEFLDYHKEIQGKHYWGHPDALAAAIAELDYL